MRHIRVLVLGNFPYKRAFEGFPEGTVQFTFISPEVASRLMVSHHDLICFTGGADVNPEMYGEESHISTRCNWQRDEMESELFHLAVQMNKPMVGICRGSQLLTVMNGGKLIQNVNNHAIGDVHTIIAHLPGIVRPDTKIRHQFNVTSTHHQMMYPFNLPVKLYEIVGYAKGLSNLYEGLPTEEVVNKIYVNEGGFPRKDALEPEVIYYPGTNSLAFQYHPEIMSKQSSGVSYFSKAIRTYLFGEEVYV